MGGLQVIPLTFLLVMAQLSSQTTCQTFFQNLYPDCKSSPDQPEMSYQECNRSVYRQQIMDSDAPRSYIYLMDLLKCFTVNNYSEITIPPRQSSLGQFGGTFLSGAFPLFYQSEPLYCDFKMSGPPGTRYLLSFEVNIQSRCSYYVKIVHESGIVYTKRLILAKDSFVTRSNVFTLTMILTGIIEFCPFNFNFDVYPECNLQLQIQCLSPTKGFIETPDWSRNGSYPSHINSCATLHVPAHHVTMISLVAIDLQWNSSGQHCDDKLYLYRKESCTGHAQTICQRQDLTPTVITDTQALSFQLYRQAGDSGTGFRLLYSFHRNSQIPLQLPDGRWDCNVSFYDSFQQHFACTAGTYCSDGRDKGRCPCGSICGANIVTTNESCYRFFKPTSTTWIKASDTCNNYNGTLAILDSAVEMRKATASFKDMAVNRLTFIGLQTIVAGVPEIYQNAWQWTDKTLAVYLPFNFTRVEPPYCAALKDSNLTMVSCTQRRRAAFLCEIAVAPDDTKTSVSMPIPSSWPMANMTTCPHNHFTHAFLACDVRTNCSVTKQEDISKCSNMFSPSLPLFTCRNQMGRVPYTLVCDFRPDCCDQSDEDFCEFPDCNSRTGFHCATGRQCIESQLVCDKRNDCVDGSDESKCWDELTAEELWTNTIQPPATVDFTSHGHFRVRQLTNATCPETHFQCPGGGYCLPVYVRCNKVYDCPGKEDEMNCDHYTCPGLYRCRHSPICLHSQHLCDNVFQCPEHDDEWMCNVTCPVNCHCYGHAFICTGFFTTGNYPELRYADVSGTGMTPEEFMNNTKLIHLSVKNCDIATLEELNFPNLQSLDLSFNNIAELHKDHFLYLKNLVSLSLAYNMLLSVDSFLNSGLKFSNIVNVNFAGMSMPEPGEALLTALPSAEYLNMSNTGLTKLSQTGFQPLKKLRILDVRGCPLKTFRKGTFHGLKWLELVYSDNYKLCCSGNLPTGIDSTRCHAPSDKISSCSSLLKTDAFRVFFTFYAIVALIGNAGSFVYRVFIDRRILKQGYEVFLTHLSISDFLMGVYLSIIGIADRIYYGSYSWNDLAWKDSVACKLAGFLSLLSNEVSALLISLITLERVLVISFPHKNIRFGRLSAHASSVAVWVIGMVLAVIPLLPMTSHWNFYGQSGLCAPFPITRKQSEGSDYTFGVMIICNFVLFVLVAVGQLLIYWSMWVKRGDGSQETGRRPTDKLTSRPLFAVVMTDFMCWCPTGLLGIMARCGIAIPSGITEATAIFVLPFNSALNPCLYTLHLVMERRSDTVNNSKTHVEREMIPSSFTSRVPDTTSDSKKRGDDYNAEEARQLFKMFLEEALLSPEQIRKKVWDIYEGQ